MDCGAVFPTQAGCFTAGMRLDGNRVLENIRRLVVDDHIAWHVVE